MPREMRLAGGIQGDDIRHFSGIVRFQHPFGADLAVPDGDHPVHLFRHAQVMGDDDDGDAQGLIQPLEGIEDVRRSLGIHGARGFVR